MLRQNFDLEFHSQFFNSYNSSNYNHVKTLIIETKILVCSAYSVIKVKVNVTAGAQIVLPLIAIQKFQSYNLSLEHN